MHAVYKDCLGARIPGIVEVFMRKIDGVNSTERKATDEIVRKVQKVNKITKNYRN